MTCLLAIAQFTTAAPDTALASPLPCNAQALAPESIFLEPGYEKQMKKLLKTISSSNPRDMQQLGYEIGISADIFLSIQESFAMGRPHEGSRNAMEAIKGKVDGITDVLVTQWMEQCFAQGWPHKANEIALEAIKNKVDGITGVMVAQWIEQFFTQGLSQDAGKLALEAIKNKVGGVTDAEVTRSIEECFAKGWPYWAGKLALEAIKNKVAGVTGAEVARSIEECLDKKRPDQAALIALEAINNKVDGVNGTVIAQWIEQFFAKGRPDLAGLIALEAIKNKVDGINASGVTTSMEECFKEMPDKAGEIALEAINNKLDGITGAAVTRAIEKCLAQKDPRTAGPVIIAAMKNKVDGIDGAAVARWIDNFFALGMPEAAVPIAIEAMQSKVDGINGSAITPWIQKCFALGMAKSTGQMAIAAIKNKVNGITGADVARWVEECFSKGWSEKAGEIALEAIKNNAGGVTAAAVTRSIAECFANAMPYQAGKIALEAIKNKVDGVATAVIARSISECFEKKMPELAGQIALEAAKHRRFSKKISVVFKILNDPEILGKENLCFSARITAFALTKDGAKNLSAVFRSAKENARILPILDLVGSAAGHDAVLKEVYAEKGVQSFVELHNGIYPHLYADILPADMDWTDPKTIAVLDNVTRFTRSKFARKYLALTEIVRDYLQDYRAGTIPPLPKGLPPPRVIEVATEKHQELTEDARRYYQAMTQIVDTALSSQASSLQRLKNALTSGISILEQKIAKAGLPETARKQMDAQITLLREAALRLDAGSSTEAFPLVALQAKHLQAIRKLAEGNALMQEMLITYALAGNSAWRKYFETSDRQEASRENIRQFVEFVDSFIKPHVLDGVDAEFKKELLWSINLRIFKKEIARTRDVSEFRRRIRLTPSRGWLAEFVGYYSDECWTSTKNILRDNPEAIVLILMDEDTQELLGGTILMPNRVNGKKILIDRGLSPRTEITTDLSMEDFMEQIGRYEDDIARALGAESILVPLRGLQAGLGSNNPDVIQYYERMTKGSIAQRLEIPNTFNGHDITQGRCVFLSKVGPKPKGAAEKESGILDRDKRGAETLDRAA